MIEIEKDLLDLSTLTEKEILSILDLADSVKKDPGQYSDRLKGKTLLMIFEKPSLRTRVSFEVGMTQLGGHAIYYDTTTAPMGKGKESISDTARCASRYCDIMMARMFKHSHIIDLARSADVPVINAMTDFSHPCQVLADLQTIREKKGRLKGLKLCYMGDSNSNVTHSLMFGCAITGMDISVGCPEGEEYSPQREVIEKCKSIAKLSGSRIVVTHDAEEAAKDADVVYTDSWMSYHVPQDQQEARVRLLTPYQVNKGLMASAKPDAIFMNCLPALRGMEQTADVIDGPQSIVFDQAENRLHAQNALMLKLLKAE
ncbi:ornithine carbamoyltransferase [Nanoarchaeota archaeon]